MENLGMGALQEGEWESLCKLLTFDEPDFATIGDALMTNSQHFLLLDQCSSNYGQFPSNMSSYETSHFDKVSHLAPQVNNDAILPTSFVTMDAANDPFLASIFAHDVINEAIARNEDGLSCSQTGNSYGNHNSSHLESFVNVEISQRKRKYNTIEIDQEVEKKNGSLPIPKKKARAFNYKSDQKNVMEKEMETLSGNQNEDEINGNIGSNGENGYGEISEEGTIGSLETGEVENSTSKGKKRASRGAATDPQSLYARRRRQRINERLRILQSLVPNGTKVDISTMLEEAVHYVKFLQLQIRLLSSDDLWMYAPIAYNGFDISLYRQYSPFQLP